MTRSACQDADNSGKFNKRSAGQDRLQSKPDQSHAHEYRSKRQACEEQGYAEAQYLFHHSFDRPSEGLRDQLKAIDFLIHDRYGIRETKQTQQRNDDNKWRHDPIPYAKRSFK
jgi:hypothetical protein